MGGVSTPVAPASLQRLGPAAQLRAGRLPRRLTQLMLGLTLLGASLALVVRGGLGMLPWDVLHYGVARHLPLSFGGVVIAVGLLLLVLWVPLREMPGLGTVLNAVWVGVSADLTLAVVPAATDLPWQVALMAVGIVVNGAATAMYIGTQLGPGPRDGLMTGLARVTPLSLRTVRTLIEITVVVAGWLLGGIVGLGTVLFALAIGPLTQLFLPWFTVHLPAPRAARTARGGGASGVAVPE